MEVQERDSLGRVVAAWCVHGYTALGLLAAAWMVYLLDGATPATPERFRSVFFLMLAATFIDSTDGALARWVRVKEVLPGFDGRRLDDLVDWLTYTCIPLFLLWKAEIPAGGAGWLLVPLVASVYGFSQVFIKTDDGYFLGFPSLWNLVAFYLYTLQPLPDSVAIGLLLTLSVLTFVPLRYLYASQPGLLNRITSVLGIVWAMLLVWILAELPREPVLESCRAATFPTHWSTIWPFCRWYSPYTIS